MMKIAVSCCLQPYQRLLLGEAVTKIGPSEPILVTDEGKPGSIIFHLCQIRARLSLIRPYGAPSPRGRLCTLYITLIDLRILAMAPFSRRET